MMVLVVLLRKQPWWVPESYLSINFLVSVKLRVLHVKHVRLNHKNNHRNT